MNILMPQLGETVEEGTVSAWHKKVGEEVKLDEVLLDVETDKVATEIPAPVTGILTQVLVEEGETVVVGTVLAVIGDSLDTTEDLGSLTETTDDGELDPSESATEEDAGLGAEVLEEGAPREETRVPGELLSPVVRRLIRDHKIDTKQITGSGRNGRVTRKDVLAFVEAGGDAEAKPDLSQTTSRLIDSDSKRIPFDRIRRVTAEHMVRSKATSPHVLQTMEVDFSYVDHVRLEARESWRKENGFSLTYLPFIGRAVCLAIKEFPRVNSSVEADALVVHDLINLAIAVDLNFEGLVAPVIQDAGDQTVSSLAHAFYNVSQRAKENLLNADDFSGGTYTLSNPGSFGMLFTAPIINQPQVAILSIDGIKKRPVVVDGPSGDGIAIRPVGVLAQSFDHRAFDGAYSAAFLNKLRTILESTDWSKQL